MPVTGTAKRGCPRGACSVSASFCDAGSHGSMRGWFLNSVNQSHAPNRSTSGSAMRSRRSALTAHLHRPVAAHDLLHRLDTVGRALHPHAEVAVAEARVVADRHGEPRDA